MFFDVKMSSLKKIVNVAIRDANGGLIVNPQPVESLPKSLCQEFEWSEEIGDHYDISPMSFSLLKLASTLSKDQIFYSSKFREYGSNDNSEHTNYWCNNNSGLILQDGKIYFRSVWDARYLDFPMNEIQTKSLISLFDNMQENSHKLADSHELDVIKTTLGALNIFYEDTITSGKFETNISQIKDAYSKLALIKINDVVGYGVIALEDIPANTIISYYTGELFKNDGVIKKRHTDHEYTLSPTHGLYFIDAKKRRNFSSFFAHAFTNLDNFYPYPVNGKEIDYEAWKKTICTSNLKLKTIEFYQHKPYAFFYTTKLISAGTLCTWDYGDHYWIKIEPDLFTLQGALVSKSTYRRVNLSRMEESSTKRLFSFFENQGLLTKEEANKSFKKEPPVGNFFSPCNFSPLPKSKKFIESQENQWGFDSY